MESASVLIRAIADLAGVFVWPVVGLIILYLLIRNFREAIAERISKTERLRLRGPGGEITADIRSNMDDVRATRNEVASEQALRTEGLKIDNYAEKLIEMDSRSAVMTTWSRFESEARKILASRLPDEDLGSPFDVIRALRVEGLLADSMVDLVNELRTTRNFSGLR